MLVVCAWCALVLTPGDGVASHGICGACVDEVLARAREHAGDTRQAAAKRTRHGPRQGETETGTRPAFYVRRSTGGSR